MVFTVLHNCVDDTPSNVLRQRFSRDITLTCLHHLFSTSLQFAASGRWQEQPKWHQVISVLQTAELQRYCHVTRIFEP